MSERTEEGKNPDEPGLLIFIVIAALFIWLSYQGVLVTYSNWNSTWGHKALLLSGLLLPIFFSMAAIREICMEAVKRFKARKEPSATPPKTA